MVKRRQLVRLISVKHKLPMALWCGFYEGEFTTNENGGLQTVDSDLTNRYLYGGIGGTFGEVTYGKNEGALGVITDFTDIMVYHGNLLIKIAIADRSDNMVSYKGQFNN